LPFSLRRAFRHHEGSARDSLAGQPEHSTLCCNLTLLEGHSVTGPSLTPLLIGLLLVLALIPAAAWLLRRAGLAQPASTAGLRVVAQLPLGPRDRIVIIEVADRRWLLGVSAAGIQRLGTLPPGGDGDAAPQGSHRSFSDIFRRLGSSQ
jgi:flagellar protein FliO/FliZ